ncbi:acyl-CoA thioesterase [Haladaptatus sp. NG-SE-30]
MDEFGHTTEIDVRYRDLDAMGHVNNAVYATFLEEARLDYFRDVGGVIEDEIEGVVAHLEIDYRLPITSTDAVTAATRVPELGESSLPMEHEIRAGGDVAATADVVQVAFDREAGVPCPIPPEWRDRIATYEGF